MSSNRPTSTGGPLTIEHLGYLWEKGLISTPIVHLGPMPITRSTMMAEVAKADLMAHGFLTGTDELTDLGRQIITTLLAPDESWWGIILERANAHRGPIAVPEEWQRFNLQQSVMTVPRVYFTVSYSGNYCAVAVRSSDDRVSLGLVRASIPRERQAADILMEILNPRREWKPASDFVELVIPHDVTAQIGKVGVTGNDTLDSQVRSRRRKAYSERGMSEEDVTRTLELLENTSRVAASMQIQHMDSMARTTPSAISIELMYEIGAVVIYPFLGFNRDWWLRACKSDGKNLLAAVKAVAALEHFTYDVASSDVPT